MRIAPRVWLLCGGAVLLYGGIAALVNRGHGTQVAAQAALAQGLSSGVTTFTMSALIDHGHAWLLRRGVAALTASVAVVPLGLCASAGQHLVVNLLAGTPELLATLAVPLAAAAVYSALYATAAHRRAAAVTAPESLTTKDCP